jgi:succinyl-CoA synthetase alpha subunit
MIYVPAAFAADAICEAADAGIEVIVCITEGIPVQDMMNVKPPRPTGAADRPELPRHHHARANARSASCPATSTSAADRHRLALRHADLRGGATRPRELGLGQSTCVGIGGDPIKGLDFIDCLAPVRRPIPRPRR